VLFWTYRDLLERSVDEEGDEGGADGGGIDRVGAGLESVCIRSTGAGAGVGVKRGTAGAVEKRGTSVAGAGV
jgi:hypothetical protein